MIPLGVFRAESVVADLLQQVRWRDGVTCPRLHSDRTDRNGSYTKFQCLVAARVCSRHSRSLTGFREIDGELDAVMRYEVQTTADTAM